MSDLFAAFGVNWKLLLVQAVNFGLLLSALTYFLYKPVLRMIDERREKVAEGVRTTQAALALGARHGIELPIALEMSEVLAGRKSPQAAIRDLMGRRQKLEHV